jgi:hypothetical protein
MTRSYPDGRPPPPEEPFRPGDLPTIEGSSRPVRDAGTVVRPSPSGSRTGTRRRVAYRKSFVRPPAPRQIRPPAPSISPRTSVPGGVSRNTFRSTRCMPLARPKTTPVLKSSTRLATSVSAPVRSRSTGTPAISVSATSRASAKTLTRRTTKRRRASVAASAIDRWPTADGHASRPRNGTTWASPSHCSSVTSWLFIRPPRPGSHSVSAPGNSYAWSPVRPNSDTVRNAARRAATTANCS